MKKINMLGLFTTNLCNLNCIYCSTDAGRPLKNELSLQEKKQIITEAKKLGANRINLHGSGEPMVDKDFWQLVEFINRSGLRVFVVTNGTLIAKKFAKMLKKQDVYILFKLNSFDSKTTDLLCGKKDSYSWSDYFGYKIPSGLKYLIDIGYLNNNRKIGDIYPLQVQTTITRQNYREIPKIAQFCKENGIYFFLDSIIKDGRARKNYHKLRTTKEQDEWLYKELVKIFGIRFKLLQKSVKCTLHGNPLIDAQGNFRFCLHRPEIIGNIREDDFENLCRKFIKMHKDVSLPISRGISNRSFKTCPGREYLKCEIK